MFPVIVGKGSWTNCASSRKIQKGGNWLCKGIRQIPLKDYHDLIHPIYTYNYTYNTNLYVVFFKNYVTQLLVCNDGSTIIQFVIQWVYISGREKEIWQADD